MAIGGKFTAKYVLEAGRERQMFERHAKRLAQAIRKFRQSPQLKAHMALRASSEYVELCDAWRAYANDVGETAAFDDIKLDKWQ